MSEPSPSSATTPPSRPKLSRRVQAGIFAGALVVWLVLFGVQQRNLRREVRQLADELARETKRQAEFGEVKAHADTYRQLMRDLNMQIDIIQSLQANRENPAEIISNLGKVMNRISNTQLTAVTIQGGRVGLSGQSRSEKAAKEFAAALKQSGNFSRLQLRPGITDKSHDAGAFAFTLDCVYSPTPPAADTENQSEGPAGKAPASRAGHP